MQRRAPVNTEDVRSLFGVIVRHLVDDPDSAHVIANQEERSLILNVKAGPGDAAKVIGKHGGTARALRTLLRAITSEEPLHYALNIVDEEPLADTRTKGTEQA